MQDAYECHNQRQLHHKSLNIIIIISNILIKHHIKYENVWTNNAVHNKSLNYVKCSTCLPLAITHALSLDQHLSIAWSMIVCLSIRRCLSLSTSHMWDVDIPTPVAMPRFCNQQDW